MCSRSELRAYLIMSRSNRNVCSPAELATSSKTINFQSSWTRAATTSALRILASKQTSCAFSHFFSDLVVTSWHSRECTERRKVKQTLFCNRSKNGLREKRGADDYLRFSTDGTIESPISCRLVSQVGRISKRFVMDSWVNLLSVSSQ